MCRDQQSYCMCSTVDFFLFVAREEEAVLLLNGLLQLLSTALYVDLGLFPATVVRAVLNDLLLCSTICTINICYCYCYYY